MVVLIANSVPPAIRGKLKLWFLEPRPNVFVSLVGGRVLDRILDKVTALLPQASGLLVIRGNGRSMVVSGVLDPGMQILENCGLPLLKISKQLKATTGSAPT